MFVTDNLKIGKHLADLIKNSEYKNDRQFGIAYLNLRDGKVNPDDIQKMQNRICQIKKGNKGIQIEDLPIFSELLGVSIEDILSAGTVHTPVSNRKTNYMIAFSKDPEEWEAYINREDKLILNPDEYNKTVVDYALEAENYAFLKYLMDNNYIWFAGTNKQDYFLGFCAGTSIKRREFSLDILDSRMKEQKDLRFKMITLAVKNKDFEALNTLHARELQLLYSINPLSHHELTADQLPPSPNIEQMIECIAASENTIISYFFDEFEIESERIAQSNSFVFPYAGQLLDSLISKKRIKESKRFLEKSIEHNKNVQKKLQQFVDASTIGYQATIGYNDPYLNHEVWKHYCFYPKIGFIAYYMPFYVKDSTGFITNLINVTVSSTDTETQYLINELKATYNIFIKQLTEKEE